jgi:integrase
LWATARLVRAPKHHAREMQAFSPDEAMAYLGSCAVGVEEGGERLPPMLALMLWTGLRYGEAAALRWREVDLEGVGGSRPSLQIVATVHYRRGDPVFRRAKTDHSKRRVVLTPQAVAELRHWRAIQTAERRRAGSAWRTALPAVRPGHEGETISLEGLVFGDEIGRPLHEQTVRRAHRRICQAAGVLINRRHDLRHTFATLMLSAGVNPKVVSAMLGHSTVNLTLTLYSHVLPHMQTEAVERLSQFLSPGPATPTVRPPRHLAWSTRIRIPAPRRRYRLLLA